MRIDKGTMIVSAARLLGLVHAENPAGELLFSDGTYSLVKFDPLGNASHCEKLLLQLQPTVKFHSNAVTVTVDGNKPFACKLADFPEPRALNAYRFCVTFAAHNIASSTYGGKFINEYGTTP